MCHEASINHFFQNEEQINKMYAETDYHIKYKGKRYDDYRIALNTETGILKMRQLIDTRNNMSSGNTKIIPERMSGALPIFDRHFYMDKDGII